MVLNKGYYALIVLAVLLVYSNSFSGPMQYDDTRWMSVSAITAGPLAIPHLFDGSGECCHLRGLAMATFNIQYWLSGQETYSYHIVNLSLHLLCAALVFAISKRLLKSAPLALTVALLFALCPVQVYAVTYIAQRFEVMATLAILLTLWLWMTGQRKYAVIACCIGCFTKEIVFITPFVIVTYSIFYEGMKPRQLAWFGAAIFVMCFAGMLVSQPFREALLGGWNNLHVTGTLWPTDPDAILPVWQKWSYWEMIDVIKDYALILVWPSFDKLTIDTDYVRLIGLSTNANAPLFYGHIPLLIAVSMVYYFCPSERRLLGFCGVVFLLSFAIYSVMLSTLADKFVIHRAYFAAFPMFLGLVTLARAALKDVVYIPAIAMVVVFGVAAHESNKSFASELALWKEAAIKAPNKVRPQYNYGRMLQVEGDGEGAERQYYKVLTIMQNRGLDGTTTTPMDIECVVKCYNNLGVQYMKTSRYEQAFDCWKLFPQIPETQNNLKKLHAFLLWREVELEKGRPDVTPKHPLMKPKPGECPTCVELGVKGSQIIQDSSHPGYDTFHCNNQHRWEEKT